jgi:hypothetical protein
LVPFLASRKRYLSAVVETVLEVFARGSQALERLSLDDGGPDARTLVAAAHERKDLADLPCLEQAASELLRALA